MTLSLNSPRSLRLLFFDLVFSLSLALWQSVFRPFPFFQYPCFGLLWPLALFDAVCEFVEVWSSGAGGEGEQRTCIISDMYHASMHDTGTRNCCLGFPYV